MLIQEPLLQPVIALAQQAGELILSFYKQEVPLAVTVKADNSPVTQADLRSHEFLCAGLQSLTPKWPILSEESADADIIQSKNETRFWLIDPLDGTKGFIDESGDFTINIALIENQQPILGVVYQPVTHTCYFAHQGQGAYKQQTGNPQRIQVATSLHKPIRIVASRHHGDAQLTTWLTQFPAHTIHYCASAIKFCQVAEGSADIYPRFAPTSLWDTAAGQCILKEAGGSVVDLSGNTLHYDPAASLLNPAFIALGDVLTLQDILK